MAQHRLILNEQNNMRRPRHFTKAAWGMFTGSYEGRSIEWPLVACDAMFYQYYARDDTYVQQYEGFGVNTFFFPQAAIFPLGQIEFEGSMYPCPARVEEYLEIQYGYIGEGAIWDPEVDRWVQA